MTDGHNRDVDISAAMQRGKEIGLILLDAIPVEDHNNMPALAHAIAFVFAGMLFSVEDMVSLHEELGMGLLDDDKRLLLFCADVKELLIQMRATREADEQQRGKAKSKRVM
jgi:hypothetical protein